MEATLSAAKVYAFVSPKGGSGKTITAITLATVISALGKSVVLIDADASTNGLSLFYLDKITDTKQHGTGSSSLSGTFQIEGPVNNNAISIAENMYLVPASYILTQTEHTDPADFRQRLDALLQSLSTQHDYIFLDAQAGTDVFAEMAVTAATEVVIVSEYDPMSAEGIERMRDLFSSALKNKRIWTLFNKVLPEFISPTMGDFLAVTRILTPIPWDADVVRAYVRKKSPVDMATGNTHTLNVLQTAVSLFGQNIEKELAAWTQARTNLVRKPVLDKLDEIEKMIAEIEEAKIDLKYSKNRSLTLIGVRVGAAFLIVFVISIILRGLNFRIIDQADLIVNDIINLILGTILGNKATAFPRFDVSQFLLLLGFISIILPQLLTTLGIRAYAKEKEKERLSLDLRLQRLQEERSRLVALERAGLSDLLKIRGEL